MSDFFWFSDTQWERIAPLLPTDVRGKKQSTSICWNSRGASSLRHRAIVKRRSGDQP